MADRKLFHEDASLDRIETEVIETGTLDGRPFVRLEATIFYPEGGGQPADRGTIAGVAVVDVRSRGSEVLHVLERPVPLGPVVAEIDAALRYDRCQQHTAQHLLTAILLNRHGLRTTAFHLGEEYTAIEVAGPVPSPERLRAFEDEVNEEIRRDRPVRARSVSPSELDAIEFRSRGLPEGFSGDVRLVEIEGIDVNTCGGTHVDRLSEVQVLRILGAEPARGGARIRFLAGGRVLREMRSQAAIEEAIRARIGTAREEFAGILDGWKDERHRLERRVRDLEAELARRDAAEMVAEPGAVLARRIDGAGPERLKALASAVLAERRDAVVALVGRSGDPPETCFLVQAGEAGPLDVTALGAKLRDALGAKGGGRGRTFQGRGGRWPEGLGFLA